MQWAQPALTVIKATHASRARVPHFVQTPFISVAEPRLKLGKAALIAPLGTIRSTITANLQHSLIWIST